MRYVLIAAVIVAGALIPLQAGMNAEFRARAGHGLHAAFWNFTVGLTALAVITVLLMTAGRVPMPRLGDAGVGGAPWWAWLGGLCGATMVFVSLLAARELGAAILIMCLIAGQLTSSVLHDHFGWVGYSKVELNMGRIVGVLLLVAGVLTIELSRPSARAALTPGPTPPPASSDASAPPAEVSPGDAQPLRESGTSRRASPPRRPQS